MVPLPLQPGHELERQRSRDVDQNGDGIVRGIVTVVGQVRRDPHVPVEPGLEIGREVRLVVDDVLRDVYVRGKYRDVILPMVVIRRLDAVLEPTKPAVLEMKQTLDRAGIANQDAALRQAAGQAFYNTSAFTLRDLQSRTQAQRLRADSPIVFPPRKSRRAEFRATSLSPAKVGASTTPVRQRATVVLQDAGAIVGRVDAAHALHLVGQLPGAADHLADAPHALGVRVDDADRPQLVQDALRLHRRVVDALGDQQVVAGHEGIHAVHAPHHRVVLARRIGAVGDRRRRRGAGPSWRAGARARRCLRFRRSCDLPWR